jgi:hypothetical protein
MFRWILCKVFNRHHWEIAMGLRAENLGFYYTHYVCKCGAKQITCRRL